MRIRYPKSTAVVLGLYLLCFIIVGLAFDHIERRNWPPSVRNSGDRVVANSNGDTFDRAAEIISAIEQFEKVNGVPPGGLRQLMPTYIDAVLSPLDPANGWWYARLKGGGWQFGFDQMIVLEQQIYTYDSKTRTWSLVSEFI